VGASIYGPTIIGIKGNYDQVNKLCAEIADTFKWAFVNVNVRPYYSEGSKTLGFEVAEQLGWRAPDHCVVPMASGSLLTKIYKGFQEFTKVGLIDSHPTRMSGAQADGCSPIVTAWRENSDIIKPVKPNTIAKSLAIGNPADGYYALKIIQKTGGCAESVSDDEVIEGIFTLAQTEGVYTETAGGVTVAALKKMAASGRIRPDEVTVAYITGNGYKTQEVIADKVKKPLIIEPSIAQFRDIYDKLSEDSHASQSTHPRPVAKTH
jgi:threonine synthase